MRLHIALPTARLAGCLTLMLGMGIGSFPAIASHRVTLVSGSHLEATSYRMAGSLIVFSLPGGGEVGIPPRNVLQIVEQPTPAEEASPEAAVPVPRAQESSPAAATALPHVSPWDPEPGVRALIQEIAGAQSVDPRLVEAMVKVESNFDPYAVSRKGAMGLMQLMPKTARRFQVGNTFDPVQNLVGGTRYIRELLDRYGEIRLALAAYNAGEEAVDRYRGVPPFRETRDYVVRILHLLNP